MKFLLKRMSFYIAAFFMAITLNFFLPRMMPGNPVQSYLSELYKSGAKVDPATIQAVEAMFGFNSNEPLLVSYFKYIGNIFTGDWGTSFFYYPQSVMDALGRGLGWTVFLMGSALVIGFIINNGLGILVSWRRGSRLDTGLTVGGQVLANVPSVVVAMVLSLTLARTGFFPSGYAVTPLFIPANNMQYLQDVMYHAFLPVLAILLTGLGGIMGMRANMINQLGEDYITMARAKGVPETRIMFSYGARNAMIPVVVSLAMQVGFLLGGSLIIEQVFNYPGLGKIMVNAINAKDYPLMQGILLMSTIIMLCANFFADIGVLFLDPRIRKSK